MFGIRQTVGQYIPKLTVPPISRRGNEQLTPLRVSSSCGQSRGGGTTLSCQVISPHESHRRYRALVMNEHTTLTPLAFSGCLCISPLGHSASQQIGTYTSQHIWLLRDQHSYQPLAAVRFVLWKLRETGIFILLHALLIMRMSAIVP